MLTLRELDGDQFRASLEAYVAIYAAAMNPPPEQLAGRHTIMERHASYAAFRAVAAIMVPADGAQRTGPGAAASGRTGAARAGRARADQARADQARADQARADQAGAGHARAYQAGAREPRAAWAGEAARLVGFAYGFHGASGQWWHDLVSRAAATSLGARTADDWFGDSLEIAEVHVLPGHQGQGTGLAMMLRLTAGRPERAAVLSTMDANTRARRLYHGLGFTDLLTGFVFPGTDLPYAIMGAPLPLPGASPGPVRPDLPDKPSRW